MIGYFYVSWHLPGAKIVFPSALRGKLSSRFVPLVAEHPRPACEQEFRIFSSFYGHTRCSVLSRAAVHAYSGEDYILRLQVVRLLSVRYRVAHGWSYILSCARFPWWSDRSGRLPVKLSRRGVLSSRSFRHWRECDTPNFDWS